MQGVGTGSVAADHTLTLIFDSDDEEMKDGDQNNPSQIQNEQKRLSEIVEDYLDEGNLTPTNHRHGRSRQD